MSHFDIIIANGTVIDGSGSPGKTAEVGIAGDRITAVAAPGQLEDASARTRIDAAGKVICPGFIDTHSHSDLLLLKEPFVAPKVMQGVTTELIGQDGMSLAPLREDCIPAWKKAMAGLEGDYEVDWDWRDVDGYLDRIEAMALGPNVAFLAPHGNVRMRVMGLEDRLPTPEETAKMQDLLRECLDQGAFGMSTGMIYPPCCYADTDEFVALCKVLAERDALFVTHKRNASDAVLESIEELLTISRNSGCRTHISHFKVAGKRNWEKIDRVFELLDGARFSFDQYPYIAGSTMLAVILPPWAHNGGTEKLLERLQSPGKRARMKKDIIDGIEGWDNFVHRAGFEGIRITFVKTDKNRDAVGKSLAELGELRGKAPLDATFDLLLEEDNTAGLVIFHGLEEHVVKILQRPEGNVCTDGIMGAKPHPRLYGSFPRVLGRYVREQKALSLEDAIYKMTGRPASLLGLKERGTIKEGNAADIVVFDPDTVIDKATYDNPVQYPVGIDYVLVNGKVLVESGKPRPQKAGKVLRA
ncbi:MAG: N-acyl-D-amino-acid deacylase family protein [Bacillota bacterium]